MTVCANGTKNVTVCTNGAKNVTVNTNVTVHTSGAMSCDS